MTTSPPPPPARRKGITTGAAAAALGVAHATLLLWVADGHVTPAYRTGGGHYRWYLEDLQREVDAMLRARNPAQHNHGEPHAEPEHTEPVPPPPFRGPGFG